MTDPSHRMKCIWWWV